jgi:hypothetical protein
MATNSGVTGSGLFDGPAWQSIVDLAGRLDSDVASGRTPDTELALHLARQILQLEESWTPSEIRLRIR